MRRYLFSTSLFITLAAATCCASGAANAQQAASARSAAKTGSVVVAPKRAALALVKTPAAVSLASSAPAPAPLPAAPTPVIATPADGAFLAPEPGAYTGVIIDARHLSEISRSPAPALYEAPAPDASGGGALLYPDRAHVPTPDEVQDATVVRYYYDEADAKARLVGANPLILRAVAVVGPARDAVTLTPADARLLAQADKSTHFTRNWRVGFLLPSGK